VDAGMEAEVLGFRDVLGDFVDKIDSAVVVSVGMFNVVGALVDKIESAVVVSVGMSDVDGYSEVTVSTVVDESLRVVSDGLVGELVTDVVTRDDPGGKEESVTLEGAENELESVEDLAKGVVSGREDGEPVDDSVPVVEMDTEVKSVEGLVDVATVVSSVELMASELVLITLDWVSTLAVVVSDLKVVSGLLELSTRGCWDSVVTVLASETVLMGSVLPVEKSEVMGGVDVSNSEVSAGLVLEVKLESELTLGAVVVTVGWGVVSGDGVDMVVMGLVVSGLEVSEDWGV
jgi:hypothetical protein